MVALGVGALPLARPSGVISLLLNRYRYRLVYYGPPLLFDTIGWYSCLRYIRFGLLHLCVVVYTHICINVCLGVVLLLLVELSRLGKKGNDGCFKINTTEFCLLFCMTAFKDLNCPKWISNLYNYLEQ